MFSPVGLRAHLYLTLTRFCTDAKWIIIIIIIICINVFLSCLSHGCSSNLGVGLALFFMLCKLKYFFDISNKYLNKNTYLFVPFNVYNLSSLHLENSTFYRTGERTIRSAKGWAEDTGTLVMLASCNLSIFDLPSRPFFWLWILVLGNKLILHPLPQRITSAFAWDQ